LPITLQGGEPTLHPDFYKIVNGIKPELSIDLLTNGQFDIEKFIEKIDPQRLKRDAKYASIRVSYHLETMELKHTVDTVLRLQDKGYSVGIWCIDHPRNHFLVKAAQAIARQEGIDFRLKEFLGYYQGKLYGTYRYPEHMAGEVKSCECKPSEMLIAPDGGIHRCHRDLYEGYNPYKHILSNTVYLPIAHLPCKKPRCNPCDVKIKTNRYQEYGHTSIEIR
jgi:hypothetical protein